MTSVSAKLLLFAVIFTVSSSSVFAGPVYYGDAVIQRAGPDSAPGLLGIHEIISQTGVATTWNYWADEVGNQLTPVIFKVSNDELEITGIGETHSATALGDRVGRPGRASV
ncbi:MAG: hypothetical protein P8N76_04735 [Pirellulaceae bacterium]|nr:hypothetical protein [Pirellulaceae bacterium]